MQHDQNVEWWNGETAVEKGHQRDAIREIHCQFCSTTLVPTDRMSTRTEKGAIEFFNGR